MEEKDSISFSLEEGHAIDPIMEDVPSEEARVIELRGLIQDLILDFYKKIIQLTSRLSREIPDKEIKEQHEKIAWK